MVPVEFKPSDVHLDEIPLVGTMGRAEREQGAAVMVRACQVLGDRWQPITWQQVKQVLMQDFDDPKRPVGALWVRFPGFRPDVRDLCAKGFATLDGDAATFTEAGFAKLRPYVVARPGERGKRRPRSQFLLVPLDAHYRPREALAERDGLALHPMHPRADVQFWRIPKLDAREEGVRAFNGQPDPLPCGMSTIELQRTVWTQEIRWSPRERRKIARWEGRGKAKAVPMATRHHVEVFAPTGTPSPTVGMLAGTQTPGMPPTIAIWRCRGWRRGALLWVAGASK